MPAMTAELWENLSGLQGLGWAVREGWRAEPWPLLSASAVSLVSGNSEGCCSLRGAGPSRPIPQKGGGGRDMPIPSSVPALSPV